MKDQAVIIRQLRESEISDLFRVWEKSSLPYKPTGRDTEANILEQMMMPTNRFFIAEVKNKIVGAVIASHNGRKGWINRLAVLPEYRKMGIAKALITHSESFFRDNKVEIFACLIEDWNEYSMEFFQLNRYKKHNDIFYFTKRLNPGI
ncbi:MAG: GNAT family N-acetyltransferase [Candidatus Cloacimonetes bacterium]|nr:GNAT family N-acetyltransferase [Candidatus Cloacimonadota bacterium]